MTTPNSIETLERLSAQRTVRTDRLHAAVCVLFARLRELVPVGAVAYVSTGTEDAVAVSLCRTQSNVGADTHWTVRVDPGTPYEIGCTDLERPVNYDDYLHGDFRYPVTGPSRQVLVAVGRVAGEIVAALITATTHEIAAHDAALAGIERATQALDTRR